MFSLPGLARAQARAAASVVKRPPALANRPRSNAPSVLMGVKAFNGSGPGGLSSDTATALALLSSSRVCGRRARHAPPAGWPPPRRRRAGCPPPQAGPGLRARASPTARAVRSAMPPGAKGTTRVMGRSGKRGWAWLVAAASSVVAAIRAWRRDGWGDGIGTGGKASVTPIMAGLQGAGRRGAGAVCSPARGRPSRCWILVGVRQVRRRVPAAFTACGDLGCHRLAPSACQPPVISAGTRPGAALATGGNRSTNQMHHWPHYQRGQQQKPYWARFWLSETALSPSASIHGNSRRYVRSMLVDAPATRLVEVLSKATARPSREINIPPLIGPLPRVPLLSVAGFKRSPVVRSMTVGTCAPGLVFERCT